MITLGSLEGGRNNFTAVRLLLALVVLVGHAFPVSGNGVDPVSQLIMPYAWIGGIAVSGFFVISGYLVTGSFIKRGSIAFAVSRFLRLYPAVIMYSLVGILVIGPLNVQVAMSQYFAAEPWQNLRNAGLWQWEHNLPYAFQGNPITGATNGATWTLPVELRCYLAVLFLGFFGVLDSRARANVALGLLLLLIHTSFASLPLFGDTPRNRDPLEFFVVGALFLVNRKHIPLNWWIGLVCVTLPFIGLKFAFFHTAFLFSLSHLMLLLVYRTPFLNVDKFGDISYGVYLYAWPVQQLVWSPGQGAITNVLLTLVVLLPVAYLSWILVEKPAMGLRRFLKGGSKPAIRKDQEVAPGVVIAPATHKSMAKEHAPA